MDREQVWGARVAAWKASGLNINRYAQQQGYSPSGLRYWVSRLGAHSTSEFPVRLARVVRRSDAPRSAEVAPGPSFMVEVAGARIQVAPGFDRDSLATILEVLDGRSSEATQ